jgi:hypothetical protein
LSQTSTLLTPRTRDNLTWEVLFNGHPVRQRGVGAEQRLDLLVCTLTIGQRFG